MRVDRRPQPDPITAALLGAGRLLGRTLFPDRCLGCGRRGSLACSACEPAIPYLPAAVCPRCASYRRNGVECRACRRIPPALASIRATCAYEGLARSAVHTLKFRGGRHVAAFMGGLMAGTTTARPLVADVIVPAPLGPDRLRERGFNQARLLADEVAPVVGADVLEVLARLDRPPQQRLTAAQRLTNLRQAVWCPFPDVVSGKRILVIDDVVTTGATLGACAQALVDAGAARVSALVFARDV